MSIGDVDISNMSACVFVCNELYAFEGYYTFM